MSEITPQQAFEFAFQHHQAGRLAEAEALYQRALSAKSDHADVLHMLGVVQVQLGRPDAGVPYIEKACVLAPNNATLHSNLGEAYRLTGRFDDAIAELRRALALNPNYPEAQNNLGIALAARGHFREATAAFQSAIVLKPDYGEAHLNLGKALAVLGQADDAIAVFRQGIELNPDSVESHMCLGQLYRDQGKLDAALIVYRRLAQLLPDCAATQVNLAGILRGLGKFDEAISAIHRALELKANDAEAQNSLAGLLGDQGRFDNALAAVHRALELKPDFPEAYYNLGNALAAQGQEDTAIDAFREAIRLKPDYADAYNNLGAALQKVGRLDESIAAFRHALASRVENVETYYNLSMVLRLNGQPEEAVAVCRRALEIAPSHAKTHNSLGNALIDIGQVAEAKAAYSRALELNPNDDVAKFNYACLLLLCGDYERGWPMYEARWKGTRSEERTFSKPRWRGEDTAGKRVLIHAEQGFGDAIQFVRYASLIAERGAKAVIACPQPLVELFRDAKDVVEVIPAENPLPIFDVHLPMLSQPLVFQTSVETIPHDVPYLFADAARCETWQKLLHPSGRLYRVGLSWAGDPKNRRSAARDISLSALRHLFHVGNLKFYSLQLGASAGQIQQLPKDAAIVDHTDRIKDFADTAAIMMNLDLVISVDTAVAHLAGALGRPVWTLLPFIPDWRWRLEGETTPWYPTMRLFRQSALGDWNSVIQRVAEELKRLVESRKT